jgi:NUMOD3 motif
VSDYVVYWLCDDKCATPEQDGYVGVTRNLKRRAREHIRGGRFPSSLKVKTLTRGTLAECKAIERSLRPGGKVGWNTIVGGFCCEQANSDAANKKKSIAATKRWADPEFRRNYKPGKHDHRGENNPRFGKPLSDEGRLNISQGRTGKGIGNQNWKRRKPYSAEALRKMSEASKRRWRTENANLV